MLNCSHVRKAFQIAAVCVVAILGAGCGQQQVRGHNPHPPGPPQKVHLIWKGTGWKVKLNGGPEEDPKTATTKLKYNVGPTEFDVDIQGAGASTFADTNPLSAWAGSKSNLQSGIHTVQILTPVISPDRTQMTFWDLNQGDPVTLSYTFQFKSGPPVDPIIDNGGSD